MTQAASSLALSMVANAVSTSTSGTAWTDISGYTNSVEQGEVSRASGAVYTYDGDKTIIKAGKLAPLDLKFTFVYTEDTAAVAPFGALLALAQTAGGGTVYVKWSPKGGATGTSQYISDAGIITKLNLPGGKADDANPVVCSFTLQTPYVTKSTVT